MGINDGWQSYVQENHAIPIYQEFWEDCTVIENDSNGADEQSARILDFGDVDKIIKIGGKQIHMAQRFRKPWGPNESRDPDFTLRYSRPTSTRQIEYERLMNAHGDGAAAYPRRYSFGRVHPDHRDGLYELYIFNTDTLIDAIKSGQLHEKGPIRVGEGQEMMAYDLNDIRRVGAIEKEWMEDNSGMEQATFDAM